MSSLTIFKGRTWQRRLTVLDRNTGLPVPIAGATIEFRVKKFTHDPDPPLISLGVGTGITLLNSGAGGQALLEVLDTASAVIPEDVYIGSVIVTLNGDTLPHVVVPPFKLPIRELP
jgi:hypothetical protein